VTGEGHLDPQSFEGQVVGGVAPIAALAGVAVHAIVGRADEDVRQRIATTALLSTTAAPMVIDGSRRHETVAEDWNP
jgi:glycerate kinase